METTIVLRSAASVVILAWQPVSVYGSAHPGVTAIAFSINTPLWASQSIDEVRSSAFP